MRILGEIPVRKFDKDGKQPLDPDGNPDTSFLAKIPADVAWTFQTLDKHGMVLNMAQTWHQLRPGEIRNDCGGCHAHSQKPTPFEHTAAAKPDYTVFDLTKQTPLLTTKKHDQSGKKWDAKDETGLRFEKGVKNVEYLPRRQADPRAQLRRLPHAESGQAGRQPGARRRHASSSTQNPAGLGFGITVPGTYARLAADAKGRVRAQAAAPARLDRPGRLALRQLMQSRRSLLIWKVFGQRLDGWNNDDFPYEAIPGDPTSLRQQGQAGRRHAAEPRARPHRLHRRHHAAAGSGRRAARCKAADRTRTA